MIKRYRPSISYTFVYVWQYVLLITMEFFKKLQGLAQIKAFLSILERRRLLPGQQELVICLHASRICAEDKGNILVTWPIR